MIEPSKIRDANWQELQAQLSGWRERVWRALLRFGPVTTTQLAAASGISILTVRPRVTELVQLGFAECVDQDGRDGVYRAVALDTALANWQAARESSRAGGQQLEIRF